MFVPHASEIWTKSYGLNHTQFWTFWQKKGGLCKNHFWQSVDAIFEDLSVGVVETLV